MKTCAKITKSLCETTINQAAKKPRLSLQDYLSCVCHSLASFSAVNCLRTVQRGCLISGPGHYHTARCLHIWHYLPLLSLSGRERIGEQRLVCCQHCSWLMHRWGTVLSSLQPPVPAESCIGTALHAGLPNPAIALLDIRVTFQHFILLSLLHCFHEHII